MDELKFNENHRYSLNEPVNITPNSKLYKAMDLILNRTVAVKEVQIEGGNPHEREEYYKRALREVKTMIEISEATAKIPNIYTYYYDKNAGMFYIVMQWIDGKTLAEKMQYEIRLSEFLCWMQQLCRILEIMKRKHFQHKDIKPDNIMFNSADELYLIDFNISASLPNRTEGTPAYKAPEMDFTSSTVTRDRADMFSIGVMLYQYVTGELPVWGKHYEISPEGNDWEFFKEPKEIKPETDKLLNDIIVKCMQRDPDRRYNSYNALGNDLKRAERSIRNAGRH